MTPMKTETNVEAATNVFEARRQADREHLKTREGHTITTETATRCGLACVRRVCSCGWSGDWRRAL